MVRNCEAVRALVQRVSEASVEVAGERVAAIGPGLLVLVAAGAGDGTEQAVWTAGKIARLRVFPDEDGRMNRSVIDAGGAVLAVSQFTLYGDVSRGNRPGFTAAAPPEEAEALVDRFADALRELGVPVQHGVFGAHMRVALVNDGPVTIWIESP
ncbi:MAG TPA: D-aminoacyl-tRNA deacylase [Gaiellales bacterium]|jgi:D-tyrosyl-tRNA(Tyr) deacylase